VTSEVDKLSELAENISSVADSVLPVSYNSSTIIDDVFYDRLQQTKTSVEQLVSLGSRFFDRMTPVSYNNSYPRFSLFFIRHNFQLKQGLC